ncbi:unnamed protein product [Paramecium primaurelia]|uniref:Uncharacterized protein n=1 Tax=Paramecium primaurelia TaxID=5886 RepID=A0A8S1NP14_PARPR|nr:unnamed protein product [Paramecium primaurelia]
MQQIFRLILFVVFNYPSLVVGCVTDNQIAFMTARLIRIHRAFAKFNKKTTII